jgi:hypothetical protein
MRALKRRCKSETGSDPSGQWSRDLKVPQQGAGIHVSRMSVDHNRLESVHAAKCGLAAKALRSFGSLRLQVTGLSMIPSVWPGDLVLIRQKEIGQIVPGDIVLFARGGRLIAHRVVCEAGDHETMRLITRGDSLLKEDSAITRVELLGKVCSVFSAGEWIEPRQRLSFGARLMAKLVSRSGRVAWVLVRFRALRQHSERKQEALGKK